MRTKVKYPPTQNEPMLLNDRAMDPLPNKKLVQAYSKREAEQELNSAQVHQLINHGLPFAELEDLQAIIDIPLDQLAQKLGISRATLHRRKALGRLDKQESDRVVRFARLFGTAVQVMGSPEAASAWLNAPQYGLGGEVPLDYAETEWGAREVEDLLGRIEYGVYA